MANWQDTYEKLKKRKKIIDEVSSPEEIKTIDRVNNYSLPVKTGRVNNLSSVNTVEKVSDTLLGFNNIKRVTTFNSPSLLDDDSPFNTNIKTTVNTTNDDKKKEVKTEKKEVKQTKEDKKIAKFYQAKDYSTYSDEELKKEKSKLEKELVNQIKKLNKTAWWDKDDNIIENVGNVLYKSFLERDPNVHDDEYYKYKAIEKQLKDIKDITENRYVANKKLDTVDKIGYTFGGNIETGFKGVESTALKILGQEEQINPDLSVREKLASKSREESSGAGQVGLDILGSVGRMTPQIMVGNPVGATAVGFANYGGGAYNEAKRDGYSEEQATKYGITVGAMEMATEKVLGAFGDVYGTTKAGKVSQSVIDKVIPKIISNKQVRNVMNQFIAEGSEEFLQEYLGNIAKDTILDEKGLLKSTYQNITDTDVLADALYSAFVGGLTGGVMSVPGQVDAYRYEKATGRSAETGLTTNEQSVVDNVVSERQTELQKKKAVDNEVNKAIKDLESTYGTLTNAEKKGIRKDIQAKLDNGEIDFSTSKLSKKEISNIEKQVKDDLRKGYISTDAIEKTLGTDADLSLDAYLQRSYNEKSLRSKQFTYQTSDSDSEFRKELAKTTDVLNDTTRSHELFETVSKISEDTGTKYGFVNNEKLKSLGHDVEGKTINGLVRVNEDGTSKILINVDSDKALNTIIGHETTHLLEGTKEYQSLQNIVKEYAKNKGDYDSKYNQINSLYQGTNANVDNEVTSDLVGDYLFTDEEFVKNLSAKEPTVFQKVYDYIKHVYNLVTAGSKEQRELEKVKYRFEQAYNEMSKTTTQQAETNLTTESESNTIKYHISEKFSKDIDDMVRDVKRTMEQDVIDDQYIDELIHNSDSYREDDNDNTNYDEVRDALMEALEKEGIAGRYDEGKDKYIYDRQELAKKGYDELLNYLDKNNVNYEVSRSTEAGYVPSIYIKNAEGETIYRIANHDNGYVDDFDMVYNGAYNTLYSDKDYANWKERILPKIEKEIGSLEKQSTKYSLSDNQGRTLSKEQQEYFKDSKVRDEEGNLLTVYHGSNSDFTIFDLNKSGESNKSAKVGFWFTESRQGAENFSNSIWYGNNKPTTYEVYLNIKNPKVYESVENEELKQQYKNEAKELEEKANVINRRYFWSETGDYQIASTFDTFKRKLKYNETDVDAIALAKGRGISEQRAKEMLNDAEKYLELSKQAEQKQNEYNKLRYNDSYEQFRTDIYELAGKGAEDANFGGIGMMLDNENEVIKQYRQKLIDEGYDGIVIKNTRYDTDTLGAGNNQYVAFYPEQIKNVDNTTPTNNLDIRYSLSVSEANTTKDNEDRKLTKGQKEYFKDSKVVDENGNLITVYHTMTNKGIQFNEFNPVGTDYYKFGDQVVNYYTDSKNMSGSYAQQNYEMADTSKLNNLSEAYDYVEKIKNIPNTIFSNDVMQTLNLEENNGKYALKFNGNIMVTYDSEADILKKIKVDLDNRYGKSNKYQYEGYVNITNPYVVNAEGKNWDNVSRRIEDKKLNVIKSLTDKQKTELNKLALESEKLHDNYLQNDNEDFYLLQNAYSDLPGDVQYEIDVMYRLTGDLKNADSKIAVWGKDQSLREITLKQFAKEYTEAVDKREKYKYPMNYFKSKYQDIANYGEIEAEELYNIALSNFNFSDKEYEKRFSKANSTNDVVKQVIDMNKNGSKYDGVIFKNVYDYGSYSGKNEQTPNDVYVTFNSNQFKAVDNANPTSDADIRYSLSEKGTLVDDKGNDVTLEASDTGNTNTLMAIHNLSASKLKGILELGGFPVPSIAVMNPGTTNLSYGEISVLFDKSTIDPSNKANEVYGSDVYSPRFPQTVQKVNEKELSKLENYLGKSLYLEDTTLDETVQKNRYTKKFIDKFAKENNITVENVYKDSGFNYTFSTDEDVKNFIIENDITFEKLLNNEQLRNKFYDLYRKSTPERVRNFAERKIETFEKAFADNNTNIGNRLDSDFNYIKNGSEKVLDEYATEKALRDKVLGQYEEQYTKFLTEKLTPVFENKYIRNNKELFTPKGNRRNFNQLYNEYTLDNVVKEMKGKVRGEEGFFYGAGNIRSQVTPQFKSIADIKANEGKLVTNAQMKEIKADIDSDLNNLSVIANNFGGYSYNSYETALNEIAGLKKITPAKAKEILSDYGFEDVPDILVDKSIEFLEKLKNAPTEYFEAKPQRAVGLDEVQAIVIPNDTDVNLKQQLSDRGLYVVEYDPNIEGDRQNKINQFDDLKFSLSNQREEIAPVGNYNVYGKDVRLQQVQEAIAPLQEQVKALTDQLTSLTENVAPVSRDIVENERINSFNSLTDEEAPTNLSNEELNELNRLNSLPFDLEGAEQNRVDELTNKQNEYGTFSMDNEAPNIKNKSEIVKELKGFGMNQQEARNLYNKIANDSNTTSEDIFNELKNYRDIYEDSEYYKEIRNDIKGTRLNISNIKDQITDYGNSYRMSLMGKKLILGNSGQSIDTFYQELSSRYPDVFSPEITAEVDQLNTIADFLYKDDKMLVDRLSDEEITELADKIYNEIDTTERLKNTRETIYSASNFKDLVSKLEKGEITEEDYETALKNLPNELSEDYAPYLEMARELNASDTDKTQRKDRIRSLLDEKSIKSQETENEPTITSNNPFEELLDKFLKRQRTKPTENTKVEKSKLRSLTDTVKELTINRNVEIDNLAKESGNLNIKYAGDMLNSVAGEVGGDIYTAQTDNEGHAIGKSVSGLFQEVKKEGLYDAFNDYLEQYSNIDRHKQGKGSQTPLDVSQELVKEYESRYPRFIGLAKDVWNYGANVRANMVDSGLITQEFADTLKEMYPHYVPFMENREMTNTYQDIGEAKPKSVIKRAKGGAKNILPIEEALTKYTYAYKKAIRQNQLYQEIVKTLNDKVEIGADVRSDPTDLNESLYRDEKGNYLTAYVDGQQESVRISDDLYRGLKNDMESKVRDIEQRLSLITTPLQKASEVRRNLLTTWSPTFIITNPIKDIQDAVFNSKHTMSMLKNYPTSFIELSQAKSETAKQFLTLYGSGNVQGDYSVDSGLNKGVVQKNAKFLKRISKINDIVELAPRYAEFKASLENGATIQEAMYNAREITTNFNRGGVITKALNRNGATFLNVSVQGFDKFVRNFSGENGAKGVVGSLLKASLFGVLPAVFNEMAFGGDDDDDKDEDYEALPNYIKDNYYLIKTENGDFIRIPKGRMLSVFGSTARRTLEYMQGNEDAFEGYLENAWAQVGFNNPEESNLLTPIKQAINNEAWYGGDLVPSRLQKLAPKEQYDASTDNFSIWLGDKLNISPYKINYVLDQYTGGIGDMLLPLITEEAQTDSDSVPDMMLAPIRDKFVVNSTSDNKYASDLYTLTDKMDKVTSDIKATDEYKIQDSYLYSITSEMAELYQERRDVQANKNLSKSEKYKKVQSIQEQINSLAKEGLDNYNNVEKTDNYAIVGGREFNKYTTDDGEERWGRPKEDELNDLNSMGMTLQEKSSYYRAKTDISSIKDEYKGSKDYTGQKREIITTIKDSGLNDEQKSYLYDKYYASSETLDVVKAIGIDFDSYLDYEYQNFTADKDADGKSISGSKKQKVFDYINSMDIGFEEKIILAKLQYNTYDEYNYDIIDYLNNNDDISYDQEVAILKKLGFKVDDEGNIYW